MQIMDTFKRCEDCRFWGGPWITDIPGVGEVAVEGVSFCARSSHWQKLCSPVRDDPQQCGPEGRWFEERQPEPMSKSRAKRIAIQKGDAEHG
jgi:hypothetical protein